MKYILTALLVTTLTIVAADMKSLFDIPLKDIEGKETTLKQYQGKVLLLVNVASQCGNTPQYEGLQTLAEKYKDQGLVVLGFPCNDFGAQEPGSNEEIKSFCKLNYKVTFPMFDKIHVKGSEKHALYVALTDKDGYFPGDVKWNFGKFLVGRNGKPLKRIEPGTEPLDPEVIQSIEAALAAN